MDPEKWSDRRKQAEEEHRRKLIELQEDRAKARDEKPKVGPLTQAIASALAWLIDAASFVAVVILPIVAACALGFGLLYGFIKLVKWMWFN